VVPTEMRALSRANSYQQQHREWQPPPGTIKLRNPEDILTNLYTRQGKQRGREGGGANTQKQDLELKTTAQPPRVSTRHLKLGKNLCVK